MKKVYIAYYYDGYSDSAPVLIAVCGTQQLAQAAIAKDKKERDTTGGWNGCCEWYIDEHEVLQSGRAYPNVDPDICTCCQHEGDSTVCVCCIDHCEFENQPGKR